MVRLISVVARGPGGGKHHEDTHNDTWKESGYKQASNGNLAHGSVQNQAHGRRNRGYNQSGQTVDCSGPARRIASLCHLRPKDTAFHGCIRNRGTGYAAHQG